MWSILKTGDWLTESRIRMVSSISLMSTIAMLLWLYFTATMTVDYLGRPLGTDFSNVWTAGQMALEGRAADAWNWSLHHDVQRAVHGRADIPFYGWHYPPPFLLLAAALATMPYLLALLMWQGVTLGMLGMLVRRIDSRRDVMLVAIGAPVVMTCLTHGHNGFLTAVLLGGGLWLLDRRPWVAGLLLGCMVYKPHLGLVLPLALIAGKHWRAVAGAALSSLTLCAATLLVWGWPVWQAFLDSLPLTQRVIIESGATGWHKIQSLFSVIRYWGGSVPMAWSAQTAMTLVAVLGAALLSWRASPSSRNAAIIAASLLSTPYVLDYDLVPLALASLMLVVDGRARGFLTWEKTCYAVVWIVPLIARTVMQQTGIPIGFLVTLALFMVAIRRAVVLDGFTLPYVTRKAMPATA
jgi:hypothetical protein